MTNYEKYEQEIKEIILEGGGIACVCGTPVMCQDIICGECDFNSSCRACFKERKTWLNAENKESITLTEREHAFCELIGRGWLARDLDESLFFYIEKPRKVNFSWETAGISTYWNIDDTEKEIFNIEFEFVQWSDTEPYSIEELLKLPVKESELNG